MTISREQEAGWPRRTQDEHGTRLLHLILRAVHSLQLRDARCVERTLPVGAGDEGMGKESWSSDSV